MGVKMAVEAVGATSSVSYFVLVLGIMLVLLLALCAVWVVLCRMIAVNKNLSGAYMWFGLLGVLGVIVVALMPRVSELTVIPTPSAQSSVSEELMRWKQLLDSGAITVEEYEQQKAKLLSSAQ